VGARRLEAKGAYLKSTRPGAFLGPPHRPYDATHLSAPEARVHAGGPIALFDLVKEDRLTKSMNRGERGTALRATCEARRPNEGNVSLAQADVLHELLEAPCPVGWLRERLGLDAGYLSRSLRWLELTGQIAISVAPGDRRGRLATLTRTGKRSADRLERDLEERARDALERLPRRQQKRLVRAMAAIVEIFERDVLANLVEAARERG
jgi:DNA-binding MarR family transcriptional regulator